MAFLTFEGDKGVHTMISLPFVNNPPISQIKERDQANLEHHRKYGSVVRKVLLYNPSVRQVFITNPDLLRAIFVGKNWERFTRYHPGTEPFIPLSGGMLFQPNGKEWRESRDLLSRTFTAVTVRQYMPIIHEYVHVLIEQLAKEQAANLAGFDVQTIYNLYTFDVISRLVFGASLDSLKSRNRNYINAWDKGLGIATIRVVLGTLLGGASWSFQLRDKFFPGLKDRFNEQYNVIADLITTHINRAQSEKTEDIKSILDDTLRSAKLPAWMDSEQLRKHFIITFCIRSPFCLLGMTQQVPHSPL
ncbi:cytochrome P450 [Gonapodya prolifera JEL478]|uniref:Cytochrome P450 n=1 Tax=Gonapodya prolifera (strain JEL478) TaxID=1344416 RepID=A0A139ABH6_GONPJ|nr:cytochrome P450 [Gonapodya prolifera JEL478]|eukprot:KXS14141.1 cytochrome P450 [Gonapodya prolifera JEL478]